MTDRREALRSLLLPDEVVVRLRLRNNGAALETTSDLTTETKSAASMRRCAGRALGPSKGSGTRRGWVPRSW